MRGAAADGPLVTDGPFLETKEVLGGFYLVEAADLDEVIALAVAAARGRASTAGRRRSSRWSTTAERSAVRDAAVRRRAAVEAAHRRSGPRCWPRRARLTRDLDLAEECAQDAFARALRALAARRRARTAPAPG